MLYSYDKQWKRGIALAYRKKYRKKKINKTKLIFCALLEFLVIMALVVMVGWEFGVKNVLEELSRPVVKELDLSGIDSQYAVLMRVNGGRVIGEINGEEKMYPASMTKIMTTIVAIEELESLDQQITLSNNIFSQLEGKNASQAGFQPGEAVRVMDLLYGAMLPSGAECCLGLAELVAGTETRFVELMNEKAKELGMENSNFCNVTGLHDPQHYSTAKDIAILLKYAIRNDTFREIAESSYHSTGTSDVHPDGITYYSTLFKNLDDPEVVGGRILGGKTGYTSEAGLCLASFAEIEEQEYIFVTAGAVGKEGENSHIEDAQMIYDRLGATIQDLLGK